MDEEAIKVRVQSQFGRHAQAYVDSPSHKRGGDLPRLVELLDPQLTERALDIATGGGNVARALAPFVAHVVASDITQAMLDAVERSFVADGVTNVSFTIADAEAMPFADGEFDIVTCRIAPHHFPHPGKFIQESARVLHPGGRFVLIDTTVPNGLPGELQNQFEAIRDTSHVRSLSTGEWTTAIESAGLTMRIIEDYPKRHEFAEWVARSGMTAPDAATLEKAMLGAGTAYADAFGIEREGDRLIAFTDIKTLFYATRD